MARRDPITSTESSPSPTPPLSYPLHGETSLSHSNPPIPSHLAYNYRYPRHYDSRQSILSSSSSHSMLVSMNQLAIDSDSGDAGGGSGEREREREGLGSGSATRTREAIPVSYSRRQRIPTAQQDGRTTRESDMTDSSPAHYAYYRSSLHRRSLTPSATSLSDIEDPTIFLEDVLGWVEKGKGKQRAAQGGVGEDGGQSASVAGQLPPELLIQVTLCASS